MTLEELLHRPTGQEVAVDTETTGLFPDDPCSCGCGRRVHITMVGVAGESFSGSFPFEAQGAKNLPEQAWTNLCEWLSKQKLIEHHSKFDQHQFDRGAPNGWKGHDLSNALHWDTMVSAWVLWPLENKGLKATVRRLFGADVAPEATEIKSYLMSLPRGQQKDFWRVPFDIQGAYNEEDARGTFRLSHEEKRQADADPEAMYFIQREQLISNALFRMEQRGVGFDVEQAHKRSAKMEARQSAIVEMLPFRATRGQALRFWGDQGIDLNALDLSRTATDRYSLDGTGMRKVVAANLPGAALLEEYLALDRALGLWYGPEGWQSKVGPDGRLRTDYRQDGAVTMRFSSSRVNLQAIPQPQTIDKYVESVRDLFVPKPGHVLAELDLSNAELRIATGYARCERMMQHFLAGTNIHDDTTQAAFGIDQSNARWDDYRRDAKILTFAMLYGAGDEGLVRAMTSAGREFSYAKAHEFISTFHNLYPEFDTITREAAKKARERGYVKLISGRKRTFRMQAQFDPWTNRWIEADSYWAAFNSIVQGGVAEMMKNVMLYIEDTFPGVLLLQIHDSVVLEVPEDKYESITTDVIGWTENEATEAFKIPMKMERKKWKSLTAIAK